MESNKIIAEFIGFKLQNNPNERWFNQWFIEETLNKPYNNRIEILHFDTDWNWLMEVVEKIETLNNYQFDFEIRQSVVSIYDKDNQEDVLEIIEDSKIQAVYDACVDFIKWYNEQKN